MHFEFNINLKHDAFNLPFSFGMFGGATEIFTSDPYNIRFHKNWALRLGLFFYYKGTNITIILGKIKVQFSSFLT